MFVEPEIEQLFLLAQPFDRSYFPELDEYDSLSSQYLMLFSQLDAVLGDREFETLTELIRVMNEMEDYQRLHYFREGVHLARLPKNSTYQ